VASQTRHAKLVLQRKRRREACTCAHARGKRTGGAGATAIAAAAALIALAPRFWRVKEKSEIVHVMQMSHFAVA
jgi:hypothetical protein